MGLRSEICSFQENKVRSLFSSRRTETDVRNKYIFQNEPLKSWHARTKHIITRSALNCTFFSLWHVNFVWCTPSPRPNTFRKFKNSTWRDTACFQGGFGAKTYANSRTLLIFCFGERMRRFSGGTCSWKFQNHVFDRVLAAPKGLRAGRI